MGDSIYYRVTGGAALDFCREYRAKWKEVEAAWDAYAKQKDAAGHVRLGRTKFGGLIFRKSPDKSSGWKQHRQTTRDASQFYVPYASGPSRDAGKALQAEIDALPVGPDDAEICPVIGFPTSVDYERDGRSGTYGVISIFSPAQIAWTDQGDTFFVVLPDVNATIRRCAERGEMTSTPEWSPPVGVELSSRLKYELAVAEAAVRAEDQEVSA